MEVQPWHRFYGEGVPAEVEIPTMEVFKLLERSYKDYPEYTAIIDGERRWSYKELYEEAICLAVSMKEQGFKKGGRAALMLPNSAEYIISYFAVQKLGGIVVQVNPMYQPAEIQYLIEDSQLSWFILHEQQRPKFSSLDAADIQFVYVRPDEREPAFTGHDFRTMVERPFQPEALPDADIDPREDVCILQYTGGTTGRSKGVMLTHYNIIANVYQTFTFTVRDLKIPGEKVLAVAPFFHVYGLTTVLNVSVFRAAAIICVERFEAKKLIDIIKKERPTMFSGVPTMYIGLLNEPEATPEVMESLKICISGSAPMPLERMNEFEQKTKAPIVEGYGLSECSPVSHRNPMGAKRKPGSIGLPIPNTEAKIVDQENLHRTLSAGEVGELLVRGPQVMKGYWRNKEETAKALYDGWLLTGDLAKMDEDGYFYIVGRKKDLIIASGFNIYPADIEAVLYEHPAVLEVCVFGVPNSYRGETVHAAVIPRKDADFKKEELLAFCRERMAAYKVPKQISIREELPKTTVGKILRRKLIEEEIKKGVQLKG